MGRASGTDNLERGYVCVLLPTGPLRPLAKFVKPYHELDRQVEEPNASAEGADFEDPEQNKTEEEKKELGQLKSNDFNMGACNVAIIRGCDFVYKSPVFTSQLLIRNYTLYGFVTC